ncbi:MAG: DUF370 domain-containing protein [Anaeromicrobium sp.]|jgi:alanine dehydrogenase|uniref:extracellular matrix regulator RemB n=1 Tax=Anaeromicrobium sp. TaxID=1929132 RepID=UPI0025FC53B8|nr:extracellular matrix/biofilm biosynthesis regulator RemA family protein [Anaeromicrobium sp.]MCT4594652.1 DUF370 domain-containing protein [Anaeromicrobium sp.]
MFLHLGKDVVVPRKNIISILDYETFKKSKTGREFLKVIEEEEFVRKISDDKIKSCVITETVEINKKRKVIKTIVYYSPISSVTLQKRANNVEDIYI